jgi:CubicO group peptidase (beta-lactamase class C family)
MSLARRVMKWSLIVAGSVLVLAAIGVGTVAWREWTYIQRLRDYPKNSITDVAWYTPREPVPGGGAPPLPRAAGEARFEPAALDEAARLADRKNASAFLVVSDGRVALERHWRGHQPGEWTNSASMAKTVTALLVGIAIDEGHIPSLDAPAATWLPAWRGDARREITLRHLLQMHSGLRPQGEYDDPWSDAAYLALGTRMRAVVDRVPAVEPPGRRFDYNNTNFQALGFILEAATRRRYAQYLSESLWKPLGAGDAALWLDRPGGAARTFGFLFAAPEDWARVGLLLLHGGRHDGRQIIPRDYLDAMKSPSPSEPRYGLGLWLAHNPYQRAQDEETFLADGVFYLDGQAKQRVYVAPALGLVVVRVGENARGWDEAALLNAVVRARVEP